MEMSPFNPKVQLVFAEKQFAWTRHPLSHSNL